MKPIFAALASLVLPLTMQAAEHGVSTAESHAAAAHAEHELPLYAEKIAQIGSFPITNSMLVSWIVAIGLIIFARVATRNIQMVPSGAQNFWEWLVESLYEFLEGIIGHHLVKKTFWFFATSFIFILAANYFGLIPGIGTVGVYETNAEGHQVFHPWLRGANADLNLTLAMATVFFVLWLIWALQANGPGGFLLHLFGPKGDTTGALKLLMIVVFFAVGFLEIISILFRPISLSLRLFGNIYAGEKMLETMSAIVPALSWLIPLPFYFMELIVGLVQAMVFMLLTAVFTLLICEHEEGSEAAHH